MTPYILRRLMFLPVVLWAVSLIVFVLMRAVPGDPAAAIAGEKAPREVRDRIRRERGFDRPIPVQYGLYMGRLLRGDLGESFKHSNEKVSTQIARKLPHTIELTLAAMAVALAGGLLLGILSAVYKGGWIDAASMTVALAGVSVPVFWLGLLFILAFGSMLPVSGNLDANYFPPDRTGFVLIDTLLSGNGAMFLDAVRHVLMPALVLSTIPLAMTARITRASMLEVLGSDYIRTARAKGASPSRVVLVHALRNAALPIVTLLGLEFGYLLGGAVLTETVFDWDGMGTYILSSVRETEYESIGGAVLVLACTFVGVNLVVDLLYSFIDPRIRHGSPQA
ncbi:MAG TPA: ABC transporter permease [Planctomycetota bacterium]|nr:ABC transporter permease [Planctomycetota bacterium]